MKPRRDPTPRKGVCVICGIEFETPRRPGPAPKYCSSRCRSTSISKQRYIERRERGQEKSLRASYLPNDAEVDWAIEGLPTRFSTWREALAWAAGFFDGEGSFGVYTDRRRGKNYKSVRLGLTQVDPRPLLQFQAIVGVGGRLATKVHVDASGRQQPCHRLQIQTHEYVQAIAIMLWEFLSPQKRTQYIRCATELNAYFGEVRVWKGRVIDATCVICGKPEAARRLCNTHYHHWWLEQGNNREEYKAKRRVGNYVQL